MFFWKERMPNPAFAFPLPTPSTSVYQYFTAILESWYKIEISEEEKIVLVKIHNL